MTLTVLRPGMLASVQDLGRHGHRRLGVCPGGALDTLALRLGNRLVGNPDDAAGLELTMGRCELRFDHATRIALTGDDFSATLDGLPIRCNWSLPVAAGQTLRLGDANAGGGKRGLRSWLAVAGGIDVPAVLGSRSTDLKAGFGGHEGRALRKGDRLSLGAPALTDAQRAARGFGVRGPRWSDDPGESDGTGSEGEGEGEGECEGVIVLRAMRGPEHDRFDAASREAFWRTAWRITPQSNRMGSRLAGPPLARGQDGDMLSAGVVPGTVQVPPTGLPIVLMGDAQTTGGYPRIGVVIRADLWKLAQAPLDGWLRMLEVDAGTARMAWDMQQRYLAGIERGLAATGWPCHGQRLRPSEAGGPTDTNRD